MTAVLHHELYCCPEFPTDAALFSKKWELCPLFHHHQKQDLSSSGSYGQNELDKYQILLDAYWPVVLQDSPSSAASEPDDSKSILY
jgi:hypothetical protein